MAELSGQEARRRRARAQLLGGSDLSPAAVVRRAGALQGQDQQAVLKAIALRSLPGTGPDEVRAAFDSGELVRGWPMRGTLFAVAPEDLAGFAAVTGPRMQTVLRTRRRNLGLTDDDFDRAREVAIAALDERAHTRDELGALWGQAGVPEGPGLNYHLVSTLAISGVLHLGRFQGRDQLVERALTSTEDEAAFLARIARAYFAARGPATIEDFAWWTKLPKSLLRPAVDAADGLDRVTVDGREMVLLDDGGGRVVPTEVELPAFDEWILGYQDRSLVASPEVMKDVATVNGIFRPVRVVDGVVVAVAER